MKAIELRDRIRDLARTASSTLYDASSNLATAQQKLLETEQALTDAYSRMLGAQLSEPETIKQQRIRVALAERQSAETELRRNLGYREEKINECVDTARSLDADLAKTRDSLGEKLKADSAYLSAAETAGRAAERLAQLEADTGDLRTEVQTKRAAYAQDRFLAYLRGRGYGTPDYKATGIAARFDAWLAARTSFAVNLANLETLDGMAGVIDMKLTIARELADETNTALLAIVEKAEAEAGIPDMKKKRDEILKDSEQYRKAALEDKAELEKYASGTDTYSNRIHEYLQRTLQEADATELAEMAARTATAEDDQLVPVIKDLRAQLAERRQTVASLTKGQRERERERDRARQLERDFESNNYGSRRYRYDDSMDVSGLLTGYMLGRISSSNDVLGSVRQHRSEEPSYSSPSYSSSSWASDSSSSSSSWSSSSSSSDFGSTSSSDSGSFSTSDSF